MKKKTKFVPPNGTKRKIVHMVSVHTNHLRVVAPELTIVTQ